MRSVHEVRSYGNMHFALFLLPPHYKSVLPLFVSVDCVLRQCGLSPSVNAADAVEVEVDVEVGETASDNFVRVGCRFQILLAVVRRTDAERLETFDVERVVAVGNAE